MFENQIRVAGCFVLLLFAGCGGGGGSDNAQTSPPPNPSVPPTVNGCPALPASTATPGTLEAIVDAAVAAELQAKGLPGMTIAIAKDATLLYARGYGYANIASCLPVQTSTEYQIGSVTKQFTAAAILKLHEAGTLDIDSTVVSHLPGYAFDPRITVRMLLNQTSGLADYTEFPAALSWIPGVAQATVLTAIAQTPLRFTPGSAHEYSNSNYFILGSVIEVVSGSTYEEYLATRIFQPMMLTHTSYTQPLTAASPYSYRNPAVPGTSGLAAGIVPHSSGYFAAGALWSNVQDLSAWNAALRGGKVVAAESFISMVEPPSVTVHQQASPSPYAMGWVRMTLLGRPFVWHNGQTLAYTSFNGMFLDNGFSVSVLTNVDQQEGTPLLPFAQNLIQSICGSQSSAGSC